MSFSPYKGSVESVLRSDDSEILRDLIAVVDAVLEKPTRLTKSGLPPKPLWTSINERLLWQDPRSVLDDWDEVDQVRLMYALALRLGLVQRDHEGNLAVGVGSDRFFLASPTRRAAMLLRAWVDVDDWDERCDARNEHGHRHHFGRAYRRDFALTPHEVRAGVVTALREERAGVWLHADDLARELTRSAPQLLLSEDEVAEIPENGIDPEISRFTHYWLYQAARFGWVDLGRVGAEDPAINGDRVFALTSLFERLTSAGTFLPKDEDDWRKRRPFTIRDRNTIVLHRAKADMGDEYLLRRIAEPATYPSWDDEEAVWTITEESLLNAERALLNVSALRERLFARADGPQASAFVAWVEEALSLDEQDEAGVNRLTLGMTAVELDSLGALELAALRRAGFRVVGTTALIPWDRWEEYVRLFGEPDDGFEYPTEEPLANIRKNAVELVWPVLPMAGRDLLLALGVSGSPLQASLDEEAIAKLGDAWTTAAVAESLRVLCDDDLPGWLSKHLPDL